MNYPRRSASRHTSEDSLDAAKVGNTCIDSSNELSFYGESSRELLEFSRYLDEKVHVAEKDDRPTAPRRSESSKPKRPFAYPLASNWSPNQLPSLSSPPPAGSATSPTPVNLGLLKIPRSTEMTNTPPGCGDIFVPPFLLGERCSPRSHRDDSSGSCSAALKSLTSATSSRKSPDSTKSPPFGNTRMPPTRTVSESLARCRSSTDGPASRGAIRPTRSSDDISSFGSNRHCASPRRRTAHSLQWDRATVQVVPGYSLPLAGLQESIAAYQRQAVQETQCQACQVDLFCIDTASMVLCPVCRTLSPIGTNDAAKHCGAESSSQQLGLGLTRELLAEELSNL